MMGTLLGRVAVLLCVALLSGAPASESATAQGAPPPNSIEVVVNGVVKRTWAANELMRHRFDWVNPKGKFRPAVALTDALPAKEMGFSPESVTELKVLSRKSSFRFQGEAIAQLKELLLVVDLDKGGVWKLAVRTREGDDRLKALLGTRVALDGVRRIEVVTVPSAEPKK
jgi:hypothetical protein